MQGGHTGPPLHLSLPPVSGTLPAPPGFSPDSRWLSLCHDSARPHPQLLDHRPHRPRQIDAGRPPPADDAAPSRSARCRTRCSTTWTSSASAASPSRRAPCASSTGAGRRRHLRAQPDRHPRPRRLPLRGLAQPRRLRGGAPGGRRHPGGRGADGRQRLPGDRTATSHIVPVINKIDLPAADPDRVKEEIENVVGIDAHDAVLTSAKTGIGIEDVLERIVARHPAAPGRPRGAAQGAALRLLVRHLSRGRLPGPGRRRHAPQRGQDPLHGLRARPTRSTSWASSRRSRPRSRSSRSARSASSPPTSRS